MPRKSPIATTPPAIGDIDLGKLAKAVLKGAFGDYWHVVRYADTLSPFEKNTDAEVYAYGRAVGSVATDIALALAGAAIVDKAADILRASKTGQKILSLANQNKYFDDLVCHNKQELSTTLYQLTDESGDVARSASRLQSAYSANIGTKLEYVFGNATGNKHNIARSLEMERTLNSIGIFDNSAGREYMTEVLVDAFMVPWQYPAPMRRLVLHSQSIKQTKHCGQSMSTDFLHL